MRVVIIGAGRVACAGVGLALTLAGHDVVFVNRDPRIAERINRHRGYVVQLAENARTVRHRVDGVRALPFSDHGAVSASIADAELIVTAVGVGNLPAVAPAIAEGLSRRTRPRNVVAFENATSAGQVLRRIVTGHADPGHASAIGRHGFSGGLTMRIVAERVLPADPTVPLAFVGDHDDRLVVDGGGLVTELPVADGLTATRVFAAWVRAKLFTLNAAHAGAAYLGHLKGYRYVHSAVRDPQIRRVVWAMASLGRIGLAAQCATPWLLPEPAAVVRRLDNASLNDTVDRVARDPLRKLAPAERLVGAATVASDAGVDAGPLALVIAATLRYAREHGHASGPMSRVLREVCGLDPDLGVGRLVSAHAARLAAVPDGALAVDLSGTSWAWRTRAPRDPAAA